MHLLALDIEAANRYVKGSICSIGLVFLDSGLNILRTKNMMINPRVKIKLNFQDKPIDLGIKDEDLKNCPTFPDVYSELTEYLSGDYLIIGHSIKNDILMLDYACKRYKLPSFNFNFFCSQDLYKIFTGNEQQSIGLSKVSSLLNIDEFSQHNAVEDSIMSVNLIKYIMDENKINFEQMTEKYEIKFGTYQNYTIENLYSPYHPHTIKMKLHEAENRILAENTKIIRRQKAEFYNQNILSLKADNIKDDANEKIKDKNCIMSRLFSTEEMLTLGKDILRNGGKLVSDLKRAEVFILPSVLNDKQIKSCRMYSYLLHHPEILENVTVIREKEI